MICVLYKSCLVLAQSNRACTRYTVVAAISLANASIEEPDNGRGTLHESMIFSLQQTNEAQDYNAIRHPSLGN